MKLKIVFFSLHFFMAFGLLAQKAGISISGMVLDSSSRIQLPKATVVLRSQTANKVVAFVQTNEQGKFEFMGNKPGLYKLTVDYNGYQPFLMDSINLDSSRLIKTLAPVGLHVLTKDLKEVTVTGTKAFITQTTDKMILNIAESPIAAGGNAYDALLRVPGLSAQNGNLSLNGKPVNVLIDGRPTHLSGDELKNMLENTPGNGIDKIEVLFNPSSKYDANGGAVINIKLAKNKKLGYNGTLTSGIGSGKYLKYNEGLTLNYKTKKVAVYGAYDFVHNQQFYNNYSERFLTANTSIVENEYDVRTRNNNSYKLGVDYTISHVSSIGALYKGSTNFRDRVVNNKSNVLEAAVSDSSSTVQTSGYARFSNPTVNVYFKTSFDTTGKRDLTINADYFSYQKSWSDNFFTRYFDGHGLNELNALQLRDHSPANNIIQSITIDYTQQTKFGNLETGIKSAFTKTDNNVLWEQLQAAIWKTDNGKTNHFIYKENINAAYINFSKPIKKYSLQLGLRAEQTNTQAQSVTLDSTNKHNYINLFPNIEIGYNRNASNQFGLSYRKSIQRFGFDFVNPFIIYQSQYSSSQGNPDIQPMIMHSIEFSYSYKYQLFLRAGYSRVTNVLGPLYRQDTVSHALISTYGNLSSADVWESSLTNMKSLFKGKLYSVNSVGAFYGKYNVSSGANAKVTAYVSSNNTVALPKKIKGELNFYYYSPIASGIYQQKSMFSANIGLSRPLMKTKATLTLNVTDVFNSLTSKYDVNYDAIVLHTNNKAESRYINLVFTYKFGSTKIGGIKARKTGIEDEKGRMGAN